MNISREQLTGCTWVVPGYKASIIALLRLLGAGIACGIAFCGVLAADDQIVTVPVDYPTIQAAVDAASPGTTIHVRHGTYQEQVVINKAVELRGEGAGKTIIRMPSLVATYAFDLNSVMPVAAIVRITDGATVRMSKLTVAGPQPCFGSSGVAVVKAATLHLSDAHVTDIHPADPGCPITFRSSAVLYGLPAFVQIDGEPEGGSIGHGSVARIKVDRYLGTGIAVLGPFAGPPSTVAVTDNDITGGTPFAVVGQGGVTVSFASVAQVLRNKIRGPVCTDAACGPDPINQFQSIGIGTNSIPSGTIVRGNDVSGADVGVYLFGSFGCCEVRGNALRGNRFFGIVAQDGTYEITENAISGGEVGVGVVADFIDTIAVLAKDRIRDISVAPIKEISCCGVTTQVVIK